MGVIIGTSKSPSISSLKIKVVHSIMPIGVNRQADISGRPAHNPIKDNLRMAWHGVESLLKMASRSLAGTPFQTPFSAVVVLIELGNVCPFPSL